MSNKTLNLTEPLYQYLLNHSLREPDVMRQLRETTARLPECNMQIAPEQAQFMQLLIRLGNARLAIEIGTFTGYSALAMAIALPDNGQLVCCDLSQDWMEIGKPYWQTAGVAHKIDFHQGDALNTLKKLVADGKQEQFDLAFIDADKENYRHYYEYCLQLVKPGGLILIDNTLWDGAVIDKKNQQRSTRAIRDFNTFVHTDPRIYLSQIPVADGLTLALRKSQLDTP